MDKRDNRVRFMLKMPPELHRWVKVKAFESDESMNDHLVAIVTSWREFLQAPPPPSAETPETAPKRKATRSAGIRPWPYDGPEGRAKLTGNAG